LLRFKLTRLNISDNHPDAIASVVQTAAKKLSSIVPGNGLVVQSVHGRIFIKSVETGCNRNKITASVPLESKSSIRADYFPSVFLILNMAVNLVPLFLSKTTASGIFRGNWAMRGREISIYF